MKIKNAKNKEIRGIIQKVVKNIVKLAMVDKDYQSYLNDFYFNDLLQSGLKSIYAKDSNNK